ncbi:MAG: ribosome recycling factor [Candidatus Omnitrophica bacterium]|nr:ribosome recycling factor [Candidatus Omnitrophota bacterium]
MHTIAALNSSSEILKECNKVMQKSVETTKQEFSHVRTGRASSAIVEHVNVEYYGAHTPLKQLATISTPEPRLLVIQPWDLSCINDVERAILKSDLGLNPSNDGKIIRIPIPPLTEERRNELDKYIKKVSEEHRVSVRNIRREANERLKKLQKDHQITEDDSRKSIDEVQKLTDKHIKHIDELLKHKEQEIFEV